MKKIFYLLILSFLIIGCCNSNENTPKAMHTYEIHTVSGICDTVSVNGELHCYNSEGAGVVCIETGKVRYFLVDRFTEIQ